MKNIKMFSLGLHRSWHVVFSYASSLKCLQYSRLSDIQCNGVDMTGHMWQVMFSYLFHLGCQDDAEQNFNRPRTSSDFYVYKVELITFM